LPHLKQEMDRSRIGVIEVEALVVIVIGVEALVVVVIVVAIGVEALIGIVIAIVVAPVEIAISVRRLSSVCDVDPEVRGNCHGQADHVKK
jgi:hypothetical protein